MRQRTFTNRKYSPTLQRIIQTTSRITVGDFYVHCGHRMIGHYVRRAGVGLFYKPIKGSPIGPFKIHADMIRAIR